MTVGSVSKLDLLYRRLLITKFFTKGWGCPENMRRLLEFRKVMSHRETCMTLVEKDHPIHIDKSYQSGDCQITEGHFLSPFAHHHPQIMPQSTHTAKFQMVLPLKWTRKHKPVCIHLAGTGDHGFWRRRTLMARPLVKEAQIGSIILENPYYGCRKPKEQLRSCLQNVSDLFVMGGALVLESIALLHWCQRMGFGPLGITGVSMGGHMASLAASSWSQPLSFVPCLSWSTASMVWTQGVLSGAVSWDELEDQYARDTELYESDLGALIQSPEQHRWQDMFKMGQNFAKDYPESVDEMEQIQPSGRSQKRRSIYANVLNAITSKLSDSTVAENRARLKRLDLHSPNLPNKPVSAEVLHFMRGVMDQCTHLGHFDAPVDPSLIIIVSARQDAYMPRDKVMSLPDIWPGCEVRYVDRGHVSAVLFKQNEFRKAIIDSFDKQIDKYYDSEMASTHPKSFSTHASESDATLFATAPSDTRPSASCEHGDDVSTSLRRTL